MAKTAKAKLPKKVAGMKVPKALRKSGVLETLVGSHAGRQILADALVAAAAAAAAALVKDRSGSQPDGNKSRSKAAMSDATHAAAGAIAGFVTDAAQNFISGALSPEKGEKKPGASRRASKTKVKEPAPETTAGAGQG